MGLQRELEESRDREVAAHVHLSSVVMQVVWDHMRSHDVGGVLNRAALLLG